MADGSVIIDTKLDKSGLQKGLASLGSIAAKGVAAMSTALVGIGTYAVNVGKNFDSAMSQVAATMGTTVDQIGNLSEFAKEMGATTQFSATEAAEAMNYLALAGYDAEKQIAALPTVLNLAAAGDMDLAYASDLVTDSMAALGLSMNQLENYSDQMAKTAQKSNTSVAQLGEAILVCGGQAKMAGMDTTQMNTALGILADNGIKGSEGGTALRNVLKNLYTPTTQAEKAMKKLGISAKNSDGTLKGTQQVLQELDAAMAGLSEADRMQAMADIFDTRTIAAANALLKDSGERWNELSGEIEDCNGAAKDMAATMLDNLEGDITILKSATEGLGISMYEGLNAPLREITKTATGMVDQLNKAMKEGGFTGLAEALGDVLSQAVTKIAEFAPKLVKMAISVIKSLVKGLTSNAPAIAKAAADIMAQLAAGIMDVLPDIATAGMDIITGLADGVASALPTLITQAAECVVKFVNAVVAAAPALIKSGIALINALVEGTLNALPTLIAALPEIITAIATTLTDSIGLITEAAITLFNGILEALPTIIESLVTVLPELINTVTTFFVENVPVLIQAAITLFNSLIEALPTVIESLLAALPQIVTSITTFYTENAPVILEAAQALLGAIIDALPAVIEMLVAALPELITSIVTFITDNLPTIIQLGTDLFGALVDAIPTVVTLIAEQLPSIITAIVTTITENLPTILATGVDILTSIITGIVGAIPDLIAALPQVVSAIWDGITSIDWLELGSNLIQGLINGLSTAVTALLDGIKNVFVGIWDAIKGVFGINSPSTVAAEAGGFILDGLLEGFESAVSAVCDAVKRIFGKIWDAIKSIFGFGGESDESKEAKEAGKDIMTGMKTGITDNEEMVKNAVKDVSKHVLDTFKSELGIDGSTSTKTKPFGESAALGVRDGMQNKAQSSTYSGASNSLATAAANALNSAFGVAGTGFLGAGTKAASKFVYIGEAVGQGIANGISNSTSIITTAAKNAAQAAYNAAKKKLGIKSPSKLFAEIGLFCGRGLANGLLGSEGVIGKAMDNIVDTLTNTNIADRLTNAVADRNSSISSGFGRVTEAIAAQEAAKDGIDYDTLGKAVWKHAPDMNVYLDKEKVGSAIEPTVSEKQEQRTQAQIRRNGGNVVKT